MAIRFRLDRDNDADIWLKSEDEEQSDFSARCLGKATTDLYPVVPAYLWKQLDAWIDEQIEAEANGAMEKAERRAEWNESRF